MDPLSLSDKPSWMECTVPRHNTPTAESEEETGAQAVPVTSTQCDRADVLPCHCDEGSPHGLPSSERMEIWDEIFGWDFHKH